jgi:capsular exopolysaccharide synthesis family protein
MLTHGGPDASKLRVLVVTSAVSGEGKTTLSGNLAISLTRAGFRTLLIDGDMQAPSAHVLFDVPEAPGLCELLRGEGDLSKAIRPSPIPGLSILPAGHWTISTRQSLVGDRWRLLKKELESKFDFVVLDTSPLLLVSDAMLLAREADGVILSVLLGVSQISRVAETVNRLHAIGAELAGVVVNNVQSEVYNRYMSRSKYATPPSQPDNPTVSEVAVSSFAGEGPIAEELPAEIGTETKEV